MILLNGDDPNCIEVARDCLAPLVEVGFSENCAERIREVSYSATGSRFSLGEMTFDSPLFGEFNVRNAAMAAVAARFYGVTPELIQTALTSFEGIARRQEVRGSARGITVIDDFGHHPTAIRETLTALRRRYPGQRLWAIFEPRSNTTRRAVFQHRLPEALQLADGIFISQVAALDQIPAAERLDPEAVVGALAAAGRTGLYERDAAAIIERILPLLQPNDIVTVFSNGGFDGIHEKLLARCLRADQSAPDRLDLRSWSGALRLMRYGRGRSASLGEGAKEQSEFSVWPIVFTLQTPTARGDGASSAEKRDFHLGKSQCSHFFATVVFFGITIAHGLPAARDFVSRNKGCLRRTCVSFHKAVDVAAIPSRHLGIEDGANRISIGSLCRA